jgi:hypothetical protein
MSKILAPAAEPAPEGQNTNPDGTSVTVQRDPRTGQFVSPAAPQAPAQEPTQFQLPEKYTGKTVEEVAKMHINAEQELGRVRNEIGTYRGLVSDLTSLQRTEPVSKPVEREKIDVSGDEFITDPVGAVDKVVTARLNEAAAQQQTVEPSSNPTEDRVFEAEGTALMQAYPNLDQIIASPEFQSFATRTPSRVAEFNTAASGKGVEQVRAARRLLEDFSDFQTQTGTVISEPAPVQQQVVPTQTPVQQAAQVATEGAGPAGAVSTKPLIYEADVIKMIHNERDKYNSPSFQAQLMEAMREGRYVKSG